MITKKIINCKIIGIAFVFFVLTFLKDYTQNNFLLIPVILSVLAFSFRSTNIIYIILFLLPNQRIMTLSEGGGSVLLFIVIFYLLAELSLGKFNLIGILRKPSVILSLIFVFYTYIYGFRYGSTLELINAIKFLIVIVFFIVVGDKHRDDREFLILSIFFISFGIICSVIYPIIDNGFNLVGVRLSATNASPNNLATLSIFIVVFIYYIFKFSDKLSHNDKLILSFSLFSIFIIGVLSQSRGFLLGIVLVVFYTLLSSFNIRNIKTVIFVSLVSTLFLIIVINYLPETYQSFSERILNPKGGDVSNGRLELWIEYLSFVLDDILIFIFGFGSNDVAVRVGLDQVAHNYIIETLVAYGVLGTFVIFLIYVFSILDVTRNFVRLVIFLPFIIVNVSHFTGHGLLSFEFVFKILLVCLLYNHSKGVDNYVYK